MAATEPFQSKYRREPRTNASGTASRRRVFEADGNERVEREPRVSTGVSVSVGSSNRSHGRDRSSNDRTESPSSVTSRMNKLNLKDDKDKDDSDKEEDKSNKNNDDDEEEDKKSLKKERGGASANSARKRQARKNLREKRRSTGVVIMPGQPIVAADDEEKAVQENTAKNMEAASSPGNSTNSSGGADTEELLKQVASYEQAIEDWKDELAKAKREIESLRTDNQRLKDENSALLRVVGSLSGTGRK